eukprot:TRINITY_DN667_c1_g3_i1.p1 TRINITY_DN667_c1_g3~~TRINITY_DN667_c1_g3_i1.p1  ORF type:complete len:643 (+),score=218.59 TRINITY_DN667_c1_g3_i1:56-1930(+)
MGKRSKSVQKANVRSCSTGSNQSWVQKDALVAPIKIKTLETELKAEKNEKTLIGKALRKKVKNLNELQHEVEALKGEKTTLETQLSSEATTKKSISKKLERKLEEVKTKSRARETELRSEMEMQTDEIADLKQQLEQSVQDKQEAVSRVEAELEKTNQKLAKAANTKKKIDKTNASLNKSNEEKQSTIDKLESTISTGEKKILMLAEKLNEANDKVDALQEELEAVNNTAAARSQAAEENTKSLERKLDSLNTVEDKMVDITAHNRALEEQLKATNTKIGELKSKLSEQMEENEVMSRSNEDMQTELDRLKQLADTAGALVTEAKKLGDEVKTLKKESRSKTKKIEQMEKDHTANKQMIETLGEEKAERDAMIKDMAQNKHMQRIADENELVEKIERGRASMGMTTDTSVERHGRGGSMYVVESKPLLNVESPRFTAPDARLASIGSCNVEEPLELGSPYSQKHVSINRCHTPVREVVRERTPTMHHTEHVSIGRCHTPKRCTTNNGPTVSERPMHHQDDEYQAPVTTPKANTAPCIYGTTPSKQDKENYKAALDEQVATRRAQSKRKAEPVTDFFRFGVAGSGAPIRNSQNEVVTNVTFTRSTNYLPVDHPMSAKKSKKPRHF